MLLCGKYPEGVASVVTRGRSTYWRFSPGSALNCETHVQHPLHMGSFILPMWPAPHLFLFLGGWGMDWNIMFFSNAVLLGVGLAMDAFSVSLANGLRAPHMGVGKMCNIAGTFGAFQAAMPLLGWVCVHTIVQYFRAFEKCIPFIALALLLFIGGKMLIEGIRGGEDEEAEAVSFGGLLVQGSPPPLMPCRSALPSRNMTFCTPSRRRCSFPPSPSASASAVFSSVSASACAFPAKPPCSAASSSS